MYRRLTKTVADKGKLLPIDQIESNVLDRTVDWYCSTFIYGEDAFEYFQTHNNSVNGYTGEVYTDTLYWDLDAEGDYKKAHSNLMKLAYKLADLGLDKGLRVYFSGNKGFHLFLETTRKFTPIETANICYNLAKDADVDPDVFDASVYNVNRILRITNTRHQKSGLYKIELDLSEVEKKSEKEIRLLAAKPRDIAIKTERQNVDVLYETYNKVPETPKTKLQLVKPATGEDVPAPEEILAHVPKGKRRCVHLLENGYFGPGEREVACNYLAAYHRYSGYDQEQSVAIIATALEKRKRIFPEVKDFTEMEFLRPITQVYANENYRGGIYKCHDVKIAKWCRHAGCEHKQRSSKLFRAEDLCDIYVKYGNEAQLQYPKTGLKWLDERIRLRPKNFSVINGANGSGKTSLAVQIMENLNRQKIYNIMFSMDMADSSLFEKLGARFTNYTQEEVERAFNIHTRDESVMQVVMTAIKERLPYTIFDFTSAVTSEQIVETINNANAQFGIRIEVAFIDYAGKLTSEADNSYMSATHNAVTASDNAKNTNCHLIYLSQVSREQGDHTTPMRTSRVAKESGAWEENATCVINCWRPLADGANPDYDNYMHLYIGKNRSGRIEEGVFMWEGIKGVIRDISFQEYVEYREICTQLKLKAPTMFKEKLSTGEVVQTDRLNLRKSTDEIDEQAIRKRSNK
jgi:KaiC/GvpD/RAD55 family RecA-like ATPase